MTAKNAIYTGVCRLLRREERQAGVTLSGQWLRRGAEWAGCFFMGAVLAGAAMRGERAPFAVAFVAAAGTGVMGACALTGACLGYLTLLPLSRGLRYAAAAILTFAGAFAFWDWKGLRRPWVMPLAAAAVNGCTGFVYLSQGGWQEGAVLAYGGELLLTALSTRGFAAVLAPAREGRQGAPQSPAWQGGMALMLCAAVMALNGVSLPGGLSAARTLAAAGAVCAAWLGGCGAGAAAGALAGLSLDLSGGGTPVYTGIYALSGLGTGGLRGRTRILGAGAWLALSAAAARWAGTVAPAGLTGEMGAGCLLFLLLPGRGLRAIEAWLAPARGEGRADLLAQGLMRRQLEGAAQAFRGLYQAVNSTFRTPDNDTDGAMIFRRAAAQVCRNCPRWEDCWRKNYTDTMDAVNHALPGALQRGRGVKEDFPPRFAQRCLHFSEYVGAVDRELTALLCRRQYNSRVRAGRAAVARQYVQLSDLLEGAAAQLSRELTPQGQAQRRVCRYLREQGIPGQVAVFRDSRGQLRIHISGPDCRSLGDAQGLRALSERLGVPLRAEAEEGDGLILTQEEPLMAVAGVAARKREGETVSGDVGAYFKGPEGRLYVLLCDGMGSGAAANRESTLAVELLEQFLKAGVNTQHALAAVGSALSLRGEQAGGFTTVDLLEVDLFSGEGAVYKLGAAPTYVCRKGQVRRLTGSALPAGLGDAQEQPDRLKVRLAPGDCVLMVSDGVAGTGDDGWLCRRLAGFWGGSPKELARQLVNESPQGAVDDRTALVVCIRKREALQRSGSAASLS